MSTFDIAYDNDIRVLYNGKEYTMALIIRNVLSLDDISASLIFADFFDCGTTEGSMLFDQLKHWHGESVDMDLSLPNGEKKHLLVC